MIEVHDLCNGLDLLQLQTRFLYTLDAEHYVRILGRGEAPPSHTHTHISLPFYTEVSIRTTESLTR